jgi:hypothetical protein
MTGRLVDPLVEGRIRGAEQTEMASVNSAAVEFSTDTLKSEDWVVDMDT